MRLRRVVAPTGVLHLQDPAVFPRVSLCGRPIDGWTRAWAEPADDFGDREGDCKTCGKAKKKADD